MPKRLPTPALEGHHGTFLSWVLQLDLHEFRGVHISNKNTQSVIRSGRWQPGMTKGLLGPSYCSLLLWPRPTQTNRPGLIVQCVWVCVVTVFYHPCSRFSKRPEASEWSLWGLYLLAPLLSWASHNSSPPLTRSHCVTAASFRGEEFLPLSYKPVCLQYSVWTSNLAVVTPPRACVCEKQKGGGAWQCCVCF